MKTQKKLKFQNITFPKLTQGISLNSAIVDMYLNQYYCKWGTVCNTVYAITI